jgi:hypothetical protein
MHTINKTRDAKGMLRLWRFQPSTFMTRAAKAFADKTRQSILYAKRFGKTHQPA